MKNEITRQQRNAAEALREAAEMLTKRDVNFYTSIIKDLIDEADRIAPRKLKDGTIAIVRGPDLRVRVHQVAEGGWASVGRVDGPRVYAYDVFEVVKVLWEGESE